MEPQAPRPEAAPAPTVSEQPRYETAPERQQPPQPRVDPKELLSSAGLVMIETDRSKVSVQPPRVEEPQNLGRPRRERPKPPPQDDQLVQIETTRK